MNSKLEKLSYSFFGFIMFYSVNLLVVKSYNFNISLFKFMILNLMTWLVIYLVVKMLYKLKYILIFIITIISSVSLALVPKYIYSLILFTYPERFKVLKYILKYINPDKIKDFFNWALDYLLLVSYYEIPKKYDVYLLIINFVIVALVFSYLVIHKRKAIYFFIPILFFLIQWFRYIDSSFRYFNIYLIGLIPLLFSNSFKHELKDVKQKKYEYKRYIYEKTLPFSITISIILIILANIIINIIPLDKINDKFSEISSANSYFRSEYANINKRYEFLRESGKLGGPLELDDTVLMLVDSDERVYLRGTIKNIYTGSNWKSKNTTYYRSKDNVIISDYKLNDNSKISIVEIYPVNISTTSIFSPYIPLKVEVSKKKIFFNKDYELYYEDKLFKTKIKSYIVESAYDENIEIDKDFDKSIYLSLPEELPKRVNELANDITKNMLNDYDKVKAIEMYLAENYPYTRNVRDIPHNVDFVDNFLFEEKEGYCTYYASSLAVMARCIGIPTRYIEGFVLPRNKNNDGLYEVTNKEAHAWVEAYIEGRGWIKLEPTSSYNTDINNENINTSTDTSSINENDTNNNKDNDNDRKDLEHELDEAIGKITYKNDTNTLKNIIIGLLIFIFISLMIIRVLYINKRIKKKYIIDDNKEKGKIYLNDIYSVSKKVVGKFDYNDIEDLLFIVYTNVLDKDLDYSLINIINKIIYSNEDITDVDVYNVFGLLLECEEVFLKRYSKMRFIWYRYILNII